MSQAHEKGHYRELPEGVSPLMVLEEMAFTILLSLIHISEPTRPY